MNKTTSATHALWEHTSSKKEQLSKKHLTFTLSTATSIAQIRWTYANAAKPHDNQRVLERDHSALRVCEPSILTHRVHKRCRDP